MTNPLKENEHGCLLPLWIIGSVLVLAVVDRISIKSGKTTYASSRDSFTQRPGTVVAG